MKRILVLAVSIALLTAYGLGKKNSSNTGNSSSTSFEKVAENKTSCGWGFGSRTLGR